MIIGRNLNDEPIVLGVLADSVQEAVEMEPIFIEPPPKLDTKPNTELIKGMGKVGHPFLAAERMKTVASDVITLDIETPRMDGLTFLQKIMSQHPCRC